MHTIHQISMRVMTMSFKQKNNDIESKTLTPLVSVVIPVYNVEAYIKQAVSSALTQTYHNLEIIIVDDQSPDKSIELINQNYSDPRIRIIKQKNRGLAGARNTGIRNAKGTYIAFLDSDDFWAKDKIEKHISIMLTQPNFGFSFCSSMFIDKEGKSLNRLQAPKKKNDYRASDIFCRNPIGNGSVPVIHKSILNQIGFHTNDKTENGTQYTQYFNESLKQSEDIDCWTRIAILTATDFYYIDEPLTYYRLINTSLSADVNAQFSTWLMLLENLKCYAPDFAKQYGPVAKAFQYRYLARRSLFQGYAKNTLTFMWLAFKTKPSAMLYEIKKTLETLIAGLALACFSHQTQLNIVKRLL